jgi:hypothetical protein
LIDRKNAYYVPGTVFGVSRVCIILSSPMFTEAAGAFKKCKNQEWPFAGVSGSALSA